MSPGDTVYYRDKAGAHFGHLVQTGYKWARVQHGQNVRRVPVDDVKPWPPPRVELPKRRVRRG
jgi:hypothetical protein